MADQREYNLKRLHSLLGVVPIGFFVVQHLVVNHFIVYGEEKFNVAANFMASLPFVVVLEIFVIYLPILFHAVLGVYIVFTVRYNNKRYSYGRNWLFTLQRISGIITLIFIAWHVYQTKVQVALGTVELNAGLMQDILSNPVMFWFYIVSVLAVVFHLANGLWGFCVSWGITQSARAQKILTYATIGVFFVVSYIGIRSIVMFGMGI